MLNFFQKEKLEFKQILLFILYEFLVVIVSNAVVITFVNFWFTVTVITKDEMFDAFDNGHYSEFYEMWDEMEKKRLRKAVFGFVLVLVLCFFSFLYTFSFCTVYDEFTYNIIYGFFTVIAIDAFCLEIFVESLVMIAWFFDME